MRWNKKEFASLCGLSTGNLTNYIRRGRVIVRAGFISDTIPENRDFLVYRQEFLEIKADPTLKPAVVKPEKPPKIVKEKKEKPPKKERVTDGIKTISQRSRGIKLDYGDNAPSQLKEKQQKLIDKAEIEIKLKQLQYENLLAKNIPTDIVKNIIKQLGHSFINEYKSGMEAFLMELSQAKIIDREQFAKYKGVIVKMINTAHENAIKVAKKSVANLQKEIHEQAEEIED